MLEKKFISTLEFFKAFGKMILLCVGIYLFFVVIHALAMLDAWWLSHA